MDNNLNKTKTGIFTVILYITCVFTGAASVFAYMLTKTEPAPESHPMLTAKSTTPFQLRPPAKSITGILQKYQGVTEKLSRGETNYKESTPGAAILLGESVATKENSEAQITIGTLASITLQENAELVFANLFPENTVLQQKSGKIFYSVESTHPVAIRVLHALISASSSTFFINVIDQDIAITVQSGDLKIALVDNDNNTRVWPLGQGHRANIDDTNRQVYFISPR